jgi:Holliday junction resolvasome RuvABC endonuclease subunit
MTRYSVTIMQGGAGFRLCPGMETVAGNGPAVLTIDPGLRMGWALVKWRPGVRELQAGGFVELDRSRLYASGFNAVKSLLQELRPSAMAFEQYFLGAGAHNKESIEVRGAMKAACECAELAWEELHPSTVRANLGVKGKLKDTQIREIVASLYGIPTKYQPDAAKKREIFFPADVFDAAAVAWSADSMEGL